MEHCIADIRYCEKLFDSFYDIGSTENGGVTRLGYTEQEDRMHAMLAKLGRELQCQVEEDEVGNTYVMNSQDSDYYLIGSHLDSVIEGGRYDGVAGIIAGLMVMKWAKEEGMKVPIRVGAFRCEESSNFGCCTIGSGLITREIYKQDIGVVRRPLRTSRQGITRFVSIPGLPRCVPCTIHRNWKGSSIPAARSFPGGTGWPTGRPAHTPRKIPYRNSLWR